MNHSPLTEIVTLLERNRSQLETLGTKLIEGKRDECVAALVGLVTGIASGSPLLGTLARAGVARAFADTATERLLLEYKSYEQQKERERFIGDMALNVEALLSQAVLQLVRVQHNVHDDTLRALGGLRDDLTDFRERFAKAIPAAEHEAARLELQEVSGGALGIHVSSRSRKRVFVARQVVSGAGSVGIKLD